jgi:hypothetical protein
LRNAGAGKQEGAARQVQALMWRRRSKHRSHSGVGSPDSSDGEDSPWHCRDWWGWGEQSRGPGDQRCHSPGPGGRSLGQLSRRRCLMCGQFSACEVLPVVVMGGGILERHIPPSSNATGRSRANTPRANPGASGASLPTAPFLIDQRADI